MKAFVLLIILSHTLIEKLPVHPRLWFVFLQDFQQQTLNPSEFSKQSEVNSQDPVFLATVFLATTVGSVVFITLYMVKRHQNASPPVHAIPFFRPSAKPNAD